MVRPVRGVLAPLSLAAATLALAAPSLRADTLTVPGDSPTIQGAIVLAADGDTILVEPGTYVETIDFLGKWLTIQSTGGAAVTTIDAGGGATAVFAGTEEPAGTTLRGFTVSGGTGRAVAGGALGGGGVYMGNDSNLSLVECVVTANVVDSTLPTHGAGLYARLADSLVIDDCSFTANAADVGAAIYLRSVFVLASGCVVEGNTAGAGGSAVFIDLGSGQFTDSEIVDNIGDGLRKNEYSTFVTRCTFSGNSGWGYVHYGHIGADVLELTFLGNGLGGAQCLASGSSLSWDAVRNSVFAGGDTLSASPSDTCQIDDCSFDGAIIDANHRPLEIRNSIIRGGALVDVDPGELSYDYSDVEGLPPGSGTGNIDADPLWVDAGNNDYRLLPASPCIDSGDPAGDADPDGTVVDMGAIKFMNAFTSFGGGVAGSAGPVVLAAHGTLIGGEGVILALTGTPPLQPVVLILGTTHLGAPFKGGTLWPNPTLLINLVTNGAGQLTLSTTWPAAIPSGFSLWAQYWFPDAGAVYGFAGSNGVRGFVP